MTDLVKSAQTELDRIPSLHRVAVAICENCLRREPGTCHVPGCLFIRFRIDDIPNIEYMYTDLGVQEITKVATRKTEPGDRDRV